MAQVHPLRAFRERHNPPLSQQQLAELLGENRVSVTRWEAGSRKIPHTKVPKIAERLGVPRRDLRPDLAGIFADEAAA